MDEKDIVIDACYIIGTALRFKKALDRTFFDRVADELSKDYEINLSEECVNSSISEWHDFFCITSDNKVILKPEVEQDKWLIKYLFSDALEPEIYEKVLNAIFNKSIKQKQKTLRFPK